MSKKITLFVKFISMNLLLLLLTVLLFQTCSDDNSPTEPGVASTLAETTIGTGGGTLTTDELELNVPIGAFAGDTKISLSVEKEDAGFDNALSKEYKFEGLPQTFTKPLTIKMKYNGDLTDNSYIAIGEDTFVKSLDGETTSYRLISARDSSGYLVATIPPTSDNGLFKGSSNTSLNGDDVAFSALAIAGYVSYTSPNGHFKISFPSSVITQAYDLSDYLEAAYTKFQSLGFSYSRRTKWPIEVTVKRLESSVYGYSMNSMWGDNYGYMEFNFDKMGNAVDMKVTAGHEFFHLVQSLYDPRNRFSKAKFKSPHLWLDEASSVWSEEFFGGTSGYVSSVFDINAYEILKGAKDGSSDNAQSYGYGMASFIKYLTKEKGDDALVDVYDEIYAGKEVFSAISSVLPVNVSFSWNSYLKKLFSFSLYNGGSFRPPTLLSTARLKKHNFIVKSADDTLKTYKASLSDLGSTLFSIKNEFDKLNSAAELEFTCKGWNFQIYKVNSVESKFLVSGKDTLTLKDFKKIADKGYQIAVALYNDDMNSPYATTKDYEMEIRVKTPKGIKWIYFDIGYSGTFNYSDPAIGPPTESEREASMGTYEIIWSKDIQINGNTIIAYQDTTDQYSHVITKLQIEFEDIKNPVNIVSFSFEQTKSSVSFNLVETYAASGANAPFLMEDYGNAGSRFEYEGNITSYLTNLQYSYVMVKSDNDLFTQELLSYKSDGIIQFIIEYQ
ncbi:hypothetical protein MNBD_IGNAVI01-3089 [hydrothermal vent metagenome]|uniref:Uncharacterized protein n=1 Tax=hydrothermal vent metagenome TaxID=652676 RepID=A0A3B1CEM1_9ZZZZ